MQHPYPFKQILMDFGQRIGLHGKTFQHVPQNGQTFTTTRGIKISLGTQFIRGRISHPKFCHTQGGVRRFISRLQQLGGTTISRTSRRIRRRKDIQQITAFALCIQKRILLEEPFLQCHAASLAFLFHLRNLLSQLHVGFFRLTYALLPHSLQPLELGFQKLAFANQFRFHFSQFLRRKRRAQMITALSGLLHLCLGLFQSQTGLFVFLGNGYTALIFLYASVQC